MATPEIRHLWAQGGRSKPEFGRRFHLPGGHLSHGRIIRRAENVFWGCRHLQGLRQFGRDTHTIQRQKAVVYLGRSPGGIEIRHCRRQRNMSGSLSAWRNLG